MDKQTFWELTDTYADDVDKCLDSLPDEDVLGLLTKAAHRVDLPAMKLVTTRITISADRIARYANGGSTLVPIENTIIRTIADLYVVLAMVAEGGHRVEEEK